MPAVTVSPGSLALSATSVGSIGSFAAGKGAVWIISADMNITGPSGANIFARLTESVSSTVIATSQIQLVSGSTAFASMRCAGFWIPSSTGTQAYTLEAWADTSGCSIGSGSNTLTASWDASGA